MLTKLTQLNSTMELPILTGTFPLKTEKQVTLFASRFPLILAIVYFILNYEYIQLRPDFLEKNKKIK